MIKRLSSSAALCAALAVLPVVATAPTAGVAARPLVVAASAIGDLAPFRAIAADTLKIVEAGDLGAAKARIRDLEKSWDQAEATMKPRDAATWTTIDAAIDEALAELRTPGTKAADCAKALRALMVRMDAVQKPTPL